MAADPLSPSAAPFESVAEVRAAHAALLERLELDLGDDASPAVEATVLGRHEGVIHDFVARAAATGVYLDEVKERTAAQVLVDYWIAALSRTGRSAASIRLAQFDGTKLPLLDDRACPYVGLEPFRDRTYFFGRDRDIQSLASQVLATSLVLVMGASGSGKSSLVMGGVLPALSGQFRTLQPFVPGLAVLDALAAALHALPDASPQLAAVDAAALRSDPGLLAAALGGASAPDALLVIDQFEEVFTLSTAADREALSAALAAFLAAGPRHRVILTMREEFRTRVRELSALSRYVDDAWYAMRPMSYDELRAAVERPAALARLRFQPGIVDDLVKKVLGQPAALPLLQFTLRALWQNRARDRITREAYERIGDPLVALRVSADRFFDGLAPQTQDEVRRVLLELVRVDELLEAYRQPVSRRRVLAPGRANTPDVLALLEEHEFIRIAEGGPDGDAVVELTHEALVRNWPRLVGWIDEKRLQLKQRLVLAQVAERWAKEGRPQDGLLTGWQLQGAAQADDLTPVERELVDASTDALDRARVALQQEAAQARAQAERAQRQAHDERALAERERRLRRYQAFAFATVLVLGASLGAWSRYLRGRAEQVDAKELRVDAAQQDINDGAARTQLVSDLSRKVAQQLRADQGTTAPPVTITLHLSDESQRPRAKEIVERLKGEGLDASVSKTVKQVDRSEVRFFDREDRVNAERVAALLRDVVGEKGGITARLTEPPARPVGRRLDIWFAPGALGSSASAAPGDYHVVLGNDLECGDAIDAFAATRSGLGRALGAAFQPSDLRLLSGTAQGREYLVTVYGGALSADQARDLAIRLGGQPGIRSDAYPAPRAFYRTQTSCIVADHARPRLDALAREYVTLRQTVPSAARTRAMTELVERVRNVAALDPSLDAAAIAELYGRTSNEDGSRIVALAALRNRPQAPILPLVLGTISAPRSRFEQYQAIMALSDAEGSLSHAQKQEVTKVLQAVWEKGELDIRTDPSRSVPVRRLIEALGGVPGMRTSAPTTPRDALVRYKYEMGWSGAPLGTADTAYSHFKVTRVVLEPNELVSIELERPSFLRVTVGQRSLAGTWKDVDGTGDLELTFNADFSRAEGWWSYGGVRTKYNAFLRRME
jgi:hypothetical protein